MLGSSTHTTKWSVRIAAIAAMALFGLAFATSADAVPAAKPSYPDLVAGQPQSARVAHMNPSTPPVMVATIVNRTLLARTDFEPLGFAEPERSRPCDQLG